MQGSYMIRGEGWKYIRYADGGEYLYDLSQDPGEICNLVGMMKYRDKRNDLESEIKQWLQETHCSELLGTC